MSCTEGVSNICVNPIDAKCVDYEGILSAYTLITESCVNQHEVNEDIIALVDGIKDELDTSGLGQGSCVIVAANADINVVLLAYETEICALKSRVDDLESLDYSAIDVTTFGIDFTCLADVCATTPTTLKEWMQAVQDKACA